MVFSYLLTTEMQEASRVMSDIVTSSLVGVEQAFLGAFFFGVRACLGLAVGLVTGGLPEDYQNADKLVNIFGNFGNVQRIKFTDKQPDGALIEFDDVRCAFKAVACMNNQKIDGSAIKVTFTKIDSAIIKSEDGKSKDVRKAKENWRYSKDGKFRRICMKRLRNLSNKVIVSNLPEGKFDQLKKHIVSKGYTVKSIEGSKRPKEDKSSSEYTMAVVELASIEEAIGAVANLHNTWPNKFGEKKTDQRGNVRGLNFSLVGLKEDSSKGSVKSENQSATKRK